MQGYTLKNLTTSETYTFGANESLGANATLSLPPAAGITLPDDGAVLVIENPAGTKIDEVRYTGEEALNDPGQESSLNQIQRMYYSLEAGSERENSYKYGSDLPDEPKAYSYSITGTRTLGEKVYELKDHLGNVRVTLTDVRLSSLIGNTLQNFHPEVVSMSDYYAFGMLMVGRNWSAGEYRYGFNGKENDDEVNGVGNHQDYGLRVYDPRLGRFLSVDPLAPSFPWNSNYAFAEDDVIRCVDLDGAERVIVNNIKLTSPTEPFNFCIELQRANSASLQVAYRQADGTLTTYSDEWFNPDVDVSQEISAFMEGSIFEEDGDDGNEWLLVLPDGGTFNLSEGKTYCFWDKRKVPSTADLATNMVEEDNPSIPEEDNFETPTPTKPKTKPSIVGTTPTKLKPIQRVGQDYAPINMANGSLGNMPSDWGLGKKQTFTQFFANVGQTAANSGAKSLTINYWINLGTIADPSLRKLYGESLEKGKRNIEGALRNAGFKGKININVEARYNNGNGGGYSITPEY